MSGRWIILSSALCASINAMKNNEQSNKASPLLLREISVPHQLLKQQSKKRSGSLSGHQLQRAQNLPSKSPTISHLLTSMSCKPKPTTQPIQRMPNAITNIIKIALQHKNPEHLAKYAVQLLNTQAKQNETEEQKTERLQKESRALATILNAVMSEQTYQEQPQFAYKFFAALHNPQKYHHIAFFNELLATQTTLINQAQKINNFELLNFLISIQLPILDEKNPQQAEAMRTALIRSFSINQITSDSPIHVEQYKKLLLLLKSQTKALLENESIHASPMRSRLANTFNGHTHQVRKVRDPFN